MKITVGQLIYKVISKIDGSFDATMKKAEKSVEDVGKEIDKTSKKSEGMGKQFGNLKNVVNAFIGGAIVKGITDLAQLGAQTDQLEQSYNRLASQFGINAKDTLNELRRLSAGTISNKDLMLSANRAMVLGVAKNTEEFGQLMQIARLRARDMGLTTTQAFDDIVTGVGRGSPLILDNLGITIKAAESQESYAKSIGKTVEQLTEAEKKEALKFAVLKQGAKDVAEAGELTLSYAEQMAQLNTWLQNTKESIGKGLLPAFGLLTRDMSANGDQMEKNGDYALAFAKVMYGVAGVIRVVGAGLKGLAKLLGSGVALGIKKVQKGFLQFMELFGKDNTDKIAQVDRELGFIAEDGLKGVEDSAQEANTALTELLTFKNFKEVNNTQGALSDLTGGVNGLSDASAEASESAEKLAEETEKLQGTLLKTKEASQKTADSLRDDLKKSMDEFGASITETVAETDKGLAQIILDAEAKKKELKDSLKGAEGDDRRDIKNELKALDEIFKAEKGFDDRREKRVLATKEKLEKAGIDLAESGLDKVLEVKSLEETVEEERRIASLDAFSRFEEEQAKKLTTLTDNFVSEITLIKSKIEQEKTLQSELTNFLKDNLQVRQDDVDQFVNASLVKYGQMASSLQSLLSQQARLQAGGVVGGGGGSVTNNNKNFSQNVTINSQIKGGMNIDELSSKLGFEANKVL